MDTGLVYIQKIAANWLIKKQVTLDVLRLDEIHPIVSGNKWFKLKYYLQQARQENKHTIATFGGAYSNHIVATAYASKEAGLLSVGIIRGQRPPQLSATLQQAEAFGMQLIFVTREDYRNKEELKRRYDQPGYKWVNEGGYGATGAKGAAEIANTYNLHSYTHIVAAVGTGTMLAGLIDSSNAKQQTIGVSAMKGNSDMEQQIEAMVDRPGKLPFNIIHDYHFGGFGKHPKALIEFMNDVYQEHNLPLDIVYTGKTFFAIKDLVEKDYFMPGSTIIMIHSGGLQGNLSLPPKVLAF